MFDHWAVNIWCPYCHSDIVIKKDETEEERQRGNRGRRGKKEERKTLFEQTVIHCSYLRPRRKRGFSTRWACFKYLRTGEDHERQVWVTPNKQIPTDLFLSVATCSCKRFIPCLYSPRMLGSDPPCFPLICQTCHIRLTPHRVTI